MILILGKFVLVLLAWLLIGLGLFHLVMHKTTLKVQRDIEGERKVYVTYIGYGINMLWRNYVLLSTFMWHWMWFWPLIIVGGVLMNTWRLIKRLNQVAYKLGCSKYEKVLLVTDELTK